MRIISICPSNTELAAYLGLTDQLIAVDDYSDWPEQVQTLPRVGKDLDIDMEKVASLQPDLVLASLSVPGMEKNIEGLKKRGIRYIILNPSTLNEIGNDLLTVGKHTNKEDRAKEVKAQYDAFLDKYRDKSAQVKDRPNLYWEWWPKPIFTPGKHNWLTEISELAGGQNLFASEDKDSVQTTWTDVFNREPDHICLAWVGISTDKIKPELIKQRPDWYKLNAVKEERIHVLEEPLYCRPSPRLLVGLTKLAHLLHPELFPHSEPHDPLLTQNKG
ncbi:cobalamin-binding protein [Bacillus solimangrovi]|uniref:Cobalamin-binding protein n=1 Tax=Bacillus solimangrovi TaxID=1305675 RepID=A0A1E5LIV0_9BACI|nr:cobalamin-binding protein [Bacillus solimangrovi]OEH93991.1 cobalamin-binding protein [Bacillus solimangrovi]